MIKEVIILAGGLGTRLRTAVPDLPKSMAPVAGKPFLYHVISFLKKQGIERYIFSLGYMHETVEKYVTENFPKLDVRYSVEHEPLGTGGAIRLACKMVRDPNVLVVNGDTLFAIDVPALATFHEQHQSACTLALKPMQDFDRYGVVEINKDGYITSFKEKKFYETGLINGGVYALNILALQKLDLPVKFSFETDYLEKYFGNQRMTGMVQDEYFIDIGIPEDFERANLELVAGV